MRPVKSPALLQLIGRDNPSAMAFGLFGGALLTSAVALASSAVDRDRSFLAVTIAALPAAFVGALLLWRRVRAVQSALSGATAQATVTAVMAWGGKARVRYRFEAGGKPFEAVHVARLSRVPAVGDVVEVGYDPGEPRRSVLRAAFE